MNLCLPILAILTNLAKLANLLFDYVPKVVHNPFHFRRAHCYCSTPLDLLRFPELDLANPLLLLSRLGLPAARTQAQLFLMELFSE